MKTDCLSFVSQSRSKDSYDSLATKKNYRNYPFIEEMIGDGVENALMYIDNFKPYYISKDGEQKKGNPFSYFTTIINYAFLRRIAKEKKLLYTKYKIMDNDEFPSHDLRPLVFFKVTNKIANIFLRIIRMFYSMNMTCIIKLIFFYKKLIIVHYLVLSE